MTETTARLSYANENIEKVSSIGSRWKQKWSRTTLNLLILMENPSGINTIFGTDKTLALTLILRGKAMDTLETLRRQPSWN